MQVRLPSSTEFVRARVFFLSSILGVIYMKNAVMRVIGRLLIVTMMILPFQTVQAGMIGAEHAVQIAHIDRAMLLGAIDRPEVANQLQAMGLDLATAKERVAALTDEEVRTLAGKIDSLPAGAKGSGWGWAIVIGIAVWVYYAYYSR